MRALRELFESIPDSELPHLANHTRRGAVGLASVVLIGTTLGTLAGVTMGGSDLGRAGFVTLVNLIICGSVIAIARRTRRSAVIDTTLLVLAMLLVADFSVDGWVRHRTDSALLPCALFMPLAFAAFVPWRPRYSLLLAAACCGWVLAFDARSSAIELDTNVMLMLAASSGVSSAIAVQVRRRLWRDLERTRAQLAASDRMSNIGRMTAGVAHELKTPLAAAMNATESLHALIAELTESIGHPEITDHDLREIAEELRTSVGLASAGVRRSAEFIQALRAYTPKLDESFSARFTVASAVDSALVLLGHEVRRAGLVVDTSGVDADLTCAGDVGKLSQIVTNLVTNAIDACSRAGVGHVITVSARSFGTELILAVEDEGPGVPAPIRDRIFELLFTTNPADGGTGVGLALARDLAEGSFGGTLELVPSAQGARFELRIPIDGRRAAPKAAWTPAIVRGRQGSRPDAEAA
jgi:signal transduction histidine kinase